MVVTIPNGYLVTLRIPFLNLDPIPLRPSVDGAVRGDLMISCRHPSRRRPRAARGQAVIEFALLYAGVILPLTFMIIFVAEMLWIWHGVVDFTRDGARFAATHCYQANGANVVAYMQGHVPAIIDQNRFQTGEVTIAVEYFSLNADGTTTAFNRRCLRRLYAGRRQREHPELPVFAFFRIFPAAPGHHAAVYDQPADGERRLPGRFGGLRGAMRKGFRG